MTNYYTRARKHLPPRTTSVTNEPLDAWANVTFAEDDERLRLAEQLTAEFENLGTQDAKPVDWDPAMITPPTEFQPAETPTQSPTR